MNGFCSLILQATKEFMKVFYQTLSLNQILLGRDKNNSPGTITNG